MIAPSLLNLFCLPKIQLKLKVITQFKTARIVVRAINHQLVGTHLLICLICCDDISERMGNFTTVYEIEQTTMSDCQADLIL